MQQKHPWKTSEREPRKTKKQKDCSSILRPKIDGLGYVYVLEIINARVFWKTIACFLGLAVIFLGLFYALKVLKNVHNAHGAHGAHQVQQTHNAHRV